MKSFIEGIVKPETFLNTLDQDSAFYEWIQSIVLPNKKFYKCCITEKTMGENTHTIQELAYDIRMWLEAFRSLCRGHKLCLYYYMHLELIELWKDAFPQEELHVSDCIKNRFFDELEMIPRYIGGREVYESGVIEEILSAVPRTIGKEERKHQVLQLLKNQFHLEDGKYPEWRKEAEWPIGTDGEPMLFLFQQNKGKSEYYYFEDVISKVVRIVIQSF